jgi:hypothetical protein
LRKFSNSAATRQRGEGQENSLRTARREQGIALIVEDFVNRAMADPRVNWERKGVTHGGWTFKRGKSVEWSPTPEKRNSPEKTHDPVLCALQRRGPQHYEGRKWLRHTARCTSRMPNLMQHRRPQSVTR